MILAKKLYSRLCFVRNIFHQRVLSTGGATVATRNRKCKLAGLIE